VGGNKMLGLPYSFTSFGQNFGLFTMQVPQKCGFATIKVFFGTSS
jgi:hypothetical protein